MTEASVELRCPAGPRRLLAIMRQNGERPVVVEGNLLEFSCSDCRRLRRREGQEVSRVLHRFDLLGDLVETVEVH